ncbi:MAG: hypothetical protein ACRC33_00350 [Gemmataceae bacterium]
MTHAEAVTRIDEVMAHLWMVRTFLKHADEIQEDAEFLDVPRTVFDYCRAVEPAAQKGDAVLYVHRARGKLAKLKKTAEFFAAHFLRITDHTNWQMAAASLTACVRRLEEIFAAVPKGSPPPAPGVPPVLLADEPGDGGGGPPGEGV